MEKKVRKTNIAEEDLKYLVYEGVLIENKLPYIPEEKHNEKPRAVIKSRRYDHFDKESE